MADNKIYIEVISEESKTGRNTYTTNGPQSALLEMTTLDSNLISGIKRSIDQMCTSFAENIVADEIEMEFSFGITGKGNICILSGSSSMGIKVKMTWKK